MKPFPLRSLPVILWFFACALSSLGQELPIVGGLGCGPSMGVVLADARMFVIGQGSLHVADASDPARPHVIGTLQGLGNTRQIVVSKSIAFVASREDGLFVVDVHDGAKPRLMHHYDTIEFATGLAIAGDVLFVAQRQFGVELIDVSDPSQPRYLSVVRTGEAQSVTYHGGYLYVGVWGSSEIVTVDVRDVRAPQIVSRTPLDGFGDGVDVRNGILYAATGHHSRASHAKEGDPGFGYGHGLEIFDLADPARPAFLGRVKFPPFYVIGNDMWSVSVVDGRAFVADTYGGVFVVDVRDPRKPAILSRCLLPKPAGKDVPGYVGGLAVGRGYIYAAGGATDLHVIDAPGIAQPVEAEEDAPPAIGAPRESVDKTFVAYHPPGQVHAVSGEGEFAVAACGRAGLHVVRVGEGITPVSVTETEDFATDVCVTNHTVFAAEGSGGMSVWELTPEGRLKARGRYRVPGKRVRYVAVPAPGQFALAQVDAQWLHIVDVSDVTKPQLALKDSRLGLLYGHQLLGALMEGRYAAAFWHVTGIHWYDFNVNPPQFAGQHPAGRVSMLDGLARLNGLMLTPRRGGYVLFGRDETRPLDELPVYRAKGAMLKGRPVVAGNRLYFSRRDSGELSIVDVSNPEQPKLLEAFTTRGNPGGVVSTRHGLLIPDGNGGLLLRKENSPQ